MKWKILILSAAILQACTNLPVGNESGKNDDSKESLPTLPSQPLPSLSLSWESGHPERKAWSDAVLKRLAADWSVFDAASDMKDVCAGYAALTKPQKLKTWGELFVAIAYYESSWNPKSASVDVGSKDKRDTWSIGLYQVSVVDQPWAGGGTKYTYDELLTPEPNIHLATVLMKRQIKNTGLIFLPNSSKFRYWAVILVGNQYSKIDKIRERIAKNTGWCK